jgi:hypothetical protein
VGTNWLPGYQERNKENLLEILGGVQELAEEVAKTRPETWRAVTQTISTVGKVFGAGQAIGQIQNQLAMPARMMTSQLMFGLEGQMIPLTNTLRQTSAQINQFIRKQQAEANIFGTIGGMAFGSLVGYYFGGTAGALIGGQLGALTFGAAIPAWEVEGARYTGGGGFWASGEVDRYIATPDDEGLNPPDNMPIDRGAPVSVKAFKRYGKEMFKEGVGY